MDVEAPALDFKDQVNTSSRFKSIVGKGKDQNRAPAPAPSAPALLPDNPTSTPPTGDSTLLVAAIAVNEEYPSAIVGIPVAEDIAGASQSAKRIRRLKQVIFALFCAVLAATCAAVSVSVTRRDNRENKNLTGGPPVVVPPVTSLPISTELATPAPSMPPLLPPTLMPTIGATNIPTVPLPTVSPTNPVPTASPTENVGIAILSSVDKSFIDSLNDDGSTNPSNATKAEILMASASIEELVTDQEEDYIAHIARQWRDLGYFAVIIHQLSSPRAQGYDHTESYTHCCQYGFYATHYTVFVGARDHPMMVENQGVGSFKNWVFVTRLSDFWIRWGQIVLFMPEWDFDAFGETQIQRNKSQFPGWFFNLNETDPT